MKKVTTCVNLRRDSGLEFQESESVRVDPRFRGLYEAEYEAVFRAVYLLSGDRALAEDATQEAFARCLERWKRLGDKGWVGGWVTTTAMNVARRAMRRRPQSVAQVPAHGDVVEEMDLWRAVRRLSARQQEAVVLHYAMDRPLAEVAAAMGCEQGTVKAHLSRARESLRRILEGEPVEG
jgi:RNA polymerase sigma factor (sigma-70 family)